MKKIAATKNYKLIKTQSFSEGFGTLEESDLRVYIGKLQESLKNAKQLAETMEDRHYQLIRELSNASDIDQRTLDSMKSRGPFSQLDSTHISTLQDDLKKSVETAEAIENELNNLFPGN